MKTCGKCKVDKPTSEFYKKRKGFDWLCKECRKEESNAWRLANPEKQRERDRSRYRANPERAKEQVRAWRLANPERKKERDRAISLLRNHGLSSEEYERILADQLGVCAACGSDDPGRKNSKFFSVDHDHECCPGGRSCGRCVRGLVCLSCNTSMGYASDDPERLIALANYLYRYIYRNSNSMKGETNGE